MYLLLSVSLYLFVCSSLPSRIGICVAVCACSIMYLNIEILRTRLSVAFVKPSQT